MLDDEEYVEISALLSAGMSATKKFRKKHNLPLEGLDTVVRFKPALDLYEQMTGFKETNPNALGHHRISLYGPPCLNCGRPKRTPLASQCVDCDQ